jgi:hypothetical protein
MKNPMDLAATAKAAINPFPQTILGRVRAKGHSFYAKTAEHMRVSAPVAVAYPLQLNYHLLVARIRADAAQRRPALPDQVLAVITEAIRDNPAQSKCHQEG